VSHGGIHCLSIPTPFQVGRVNCYLIEDDPLTLVDTGPNSGKALDALEQALDVHGRSVEDLERIVITHQHPDHEGLLDVLYRRSGAEVCALDVLAPVLEDHASAADADNLAAAELLRRHGVAVDVVTVLQTMNKAFRGWSASAPVDRVLADGGELPFAGRTLRVWHRPGHSPSDTVFHDAERAVLIGGDHLIAHISSNPLLQRPLGGKSGDASAERPRALLNYMASLRETAAMDAVEVVLPGHGEPVTGAAELIAGRFEMNERRAEKISGLLDAGPRTAHELAHELWDTLALTQALLTLSEVLGHLDLLIDRGEVVEDAAGDLVRFALAA